MEANEAHADGLGGRDVAIARLIEEARAADARGEPTDDEAVARDHPALMPELGHELAKLRRIQAALRATEDAPALLGAARAVAAAIEAGRDPSSDSPSAVTVDSPVATPERPGARVGRYKLLQLIGEGGFGSVFMAEQQAPVHRRVALKIIKLGMDTRQVVARASRPSGRRWRSWTTRTSPASWTAAPPMPGGRTS